MNKIYERVLKIKEQFPSRQDWNYKLERMQKFPNNPEKWYANELGFETLLVCDSISNSKTNENDHTITKIFIKTIQTLYPFKFTSWKNVDTSMSYDQVERVFEQALKYAKNYMFS